MDIAIVLRSGRTGQGHFIRKVAFAQLDRLDGMEYRLFPVYFEMDSQISNELFFQFFQCGICHNGRSHHWNSRGRIFVGGNKAVHVERPKLNSSM